MLIKRTVLRMGIVNNLNCQVGPLVFVKVRSPLLSTLLRCVVVLAVGRQVGAEQSMVSLSEAPSICAAEVPCTRRKSFDNEQLHLEARRAHVLYIFHLGIYPRGHLL